MEPSQTQELLPLDEDTEVSSQPPTAETDAFTRTFGMHDMPLARRWLASQLAAAGFDSAVVEAMQAVPRHIFAPRHWAIAYLDLPLRTADTILPAPNHTARAVSAVLGKRVLELGTGTGYQTAVLAALGKTVTTVECNPRQAVCVRDVLARLKLDAEVVVGDPIRPSVEAEAFDAVLVNYLCDQAPSHLFSFLKPEDGVLVAPVLSSDGSHRLMRYLIRSTGLLLADLGRCSAPHGPRNRTCR